MNDYGMTRARAMPYLSPSATPQTVHGQAPSRRAWRRTGDRPVSGLARFEASPSQADRTCPGGHHVAAQWLVVRDHPDVSVLAYRCGGSRGFAPWRGRAPRSRFTRGGIPRAP